MTLRQQFREVLRLLRLTLEGRNPDMSRGELFDRSLTKFAWWCAFVLSGIALAVLVAWVVS